MLLVHIIALEKSLFAQCWNQKHTLGKELRKSVANPWNVCYFSWVCQGLLRAIVYESGFCINSTWTVVSVCFGSRSKSQCNAIGSPIDLIQIILFHCVVRCFY